MSIHLDFSPPKILETRYGKREIQTAFATPEFWAAWRTAKDSLREMGYEVTKNADKPMVGQSMRYSSGPNSRPRGRSAYRLKQSTGLLHYQVLTPQRFVRHCTNSTQPLTLATRARARRMRPLLFAVSLGFPRPSFAHYPSWKVGGAFLSISKSSQFL
jgi:hypothetical protein